MTDNVKMFYFGPWDRAGHYLVDSTGLGVYGYRCGSLPWAEGQIDGKLQPHRGTRKCSEYSYCGCGSHGGVPEGQAMLHHKDGWTALSFWDRSVDTRGACNSTYMAEGTFTFNEMVEMAKTRFAYRWNKMNFQVTEYKS